jgi:Glycosyltransferase like family 2
VLLPVRDEEANVVPCLEGLLGQTAQPDVLVIDDGSRDRTAALVQALAADIPRLRLLDAGPLPPGWLGKVHALAVGAESTTTPWLLLTDADARHHPDLLARAHAAARAWNLAALSLAGTQETRGAEALITGPVYAVLDVLLGDWRRVADSQGAPVANGQLILLRADALAAIGGFAAVRSPPLIDDVALAAALRRAGFRTGFARAGDLLSVRMYAGFAATWRGWRRNLGLIFGPSPALGMALILALALPPTLLAAAFATGNWPAGTLLWLAGALACALFRHGQRQSIGWALLYPTDAIVTAALLVVALRDHARGKLARWKGREIGPEGRQR